MQVSKVNLQSVNFAARKAPAKTENVQKENKKISGKTLAMASLAAAAVGIAAITMYAIKGGVMQTDVVKAAGVIEETITDVAKRTSKDGVAERAAELAEAFGAAVKHVPQNSIALPHLFR